MGMPKLVRLFYLVTISAALLSGCGGGGGSDSTSSSSGGGLTPAPSNPQTQQGVSAVISGTLQSILKSTVQASINRAFEPIRFAKSSVALNNTRTTQALSSTTIRLYATRTAQAPVQLGEAQTTENGSYTLVIYDQVLKTIPCQDPSVATPNFCINTWNELLTLPSPPYQLRLAFTRSVSARQEGIDSTIEFRPVVNNSPLKSTGDSNLVVNALLDPLDSKSTRLEIPAEEGTLIVEGNVDFNGDGLAEARPINVFRRKTSSQTASSVEVIEIDANGDGTFGEEADAVPARIFLSDSDLSSPEYQELLNSTLSSFLDTSGNGKPNKVTDATSPVLQFVTPLPSQVLARQPLVIRLQYGDDLGFDLGSLKISSSAGIKLTNPFQRIDAGTSGSSAFSAKFTKRRLPLGEVSPGPLSSAQSSWMLGEAAFTIPDPLDAFGPGPVTLTATLANFSENAAAKTISLSLPVVVDGPPEITLDFASLSGTEGLAYQGASLGQFATIRDVLPITLRVNVIPGSDQSRLNWLDLVVQGTNTSSRLNLAGGGSLEVIESMLTATDKRSFQVYFEGIVPQNFKTAPTIQIQANDRDGNSSVRIVGMDIRTDNALPQWSKICALPDTNSNPLASTPQNVCSLSPIPAAQGSCQSSSGGGFPLPEKEPTILVLCATDQDEEDALRFRLSQIRYTSQNPALPSTANLIGSSPLITVGTDLSQSGFRYNGTQVTANSRSTIGILRWTPPNVYGLSRTFLNFEMSDGATPFTSFEISTDVATVEDAPILSSFSASGTVSAVVAYGEPGISSLGDENTFRQWLESTNGNPKIINARQGVPYNLVLYATDDETLEPSVSLFDSGFLADTNRNPLAAPWMNRINSTGDDRLKKIVFSGTPTNRDSLQSSLLTVVTTDPAGLSNPLTRTYRLALDVLDQNDAPYFSASLADALTTIPSITSATALPSVTLTIPATEDQLLRFYVHAFDIDPTGSPYQDASLFSFSRNEDNLITKVSRMDITTRPLNDITRAYAYLEWNPTTRDTNESIPTGVNQIKSNLLQLSVRANCPTTPFYRIQCVEPVATINLNLAVQAVDEGPKFERLTVNGIQNNGNSPIRLVQGDSADIVQFIREEEAGQQFENIEIVNSHPTLSFLLNNITRSLNDGNILGSSIRMQGAPPNDAVDYETRTIDGIARQVPKIVNLTIKATPAGSSLITSRTLSFEIEDRPDAPTFTGLPNPPILTISERQTLSLSLSAVNNLDKDPKFQTGFLFRSIGGQVPSPLGNFSIVSEDTATNTTGLLSWTPGQEHANGTNSKAHLVGLEVCLREAPTVCRQQQITINVLPVDDPPVILFGAAERNLLTNPHNSSDPFPVQENGGFSQKIKAFDPDGEQIRLSAWFQLVSPAGVPGRNGVSIASGQSLFNGPMADIEPVSSAFSTQPNEPGLPLEITARWDNIDYYYIGSDPTQLTTATYHLYIKATPLGAASASTLATVVMSLQSVNDAPRFTTKSITTILEQNSAPGNVIVTLSNITTDEENNPVFYSITERYGASASFVNQTVTTAGEVTFSATPGQNNVGKHRIQVRIQENIQNSLTHVDDVEFEVRDSNDPPSFTNLLEQTVQQVQEGAQSAVQIILNDSDLASSPALEKITWQFEYSLDGLSFSPLSFTSSAGNSTTIYTTNQPWTLSWAELPLNSQLGTSGVSLVFFPQSLPGFSPATYALRIRATDSFESQFRSAITSLTWQIQPFDNTPYFISVNSQNVPAGTTASLLCFNQTCSDPQSMILKHSTTALLSVTAFNDESATNDPLTYQYASAWGNTILTTAPIGVSLVSTSLLGSSTWSAQYLLTPSNSRVGFNTMTLRINDFSDGTAGSVNVEKSATHTLAWFVQDVADLPVFKGVSCDSVSTGCIVTSGRIEILEDSPLALNLTIDDPDLHSPKSFSPLDLSYMQGAFGIGASSAAQLASTLFYPEFFEYISTNTTALPGFRIANAASPSTTLFAFSTPSNFIATSTTSTIRMEWGSATVNYTYPILGDINLGMRIRSFAAASVLPSRPTSITTNLVLRVIPVNDAPVILNTQVEAQATEGLPFSFQILAQDEEETSLSYLFSTTTPPGLSVLQSGLMQWTPTNDDTIQNFYDLGIYVRDSGKVSTVGTTATAPLSSPVYNLRLVLNDVDAPAQHDSTYTPLTTATEDLVYTSQLRFIDEDKYDLPHYYLQSISRNGVAVATSSSNFNIQERDNNIGGDGRGPVDITWNPDRGGAWSITIRVDSIKNSIVRSSTSYTYNVQVTEVNDAPVFADNAIRVVKENDPYLWNIQVTDEDGEIPILSLMDTAGCTIPTFLNLDEVNKTLTGQTNLNDITGLNEIAQGSLPIATYRICLAADDGMANTTYSFNLEVLASNNAPTILNLTSQPTGDPVSSNQDRNTLLQTVEPIVYQVPQVRPVLLKEGVLNNIHLNFEDEEGDTPQVFTLKQGPAGVSLASSQSTSKLAHLTLTWTPGPDSVNIADSGNPVAGKSATTFRVEVRDNRNAITEFEFQATVRDQPTPPCARLVNASCAPGIGLTTMIRNINEDQSQSVSLQATDFDPESVLSFSIVTSVGTQPHPTQPIYSSNVSGISGLELAISNNGNVTFLPRISEAAILGTSASVSNLVPVTFSICGTSRSLPSYTQDCTTATYTYRIQAFDDLPVFSPSFPVTRRTTASEGGSYIGLSLRRLTSTTHCQIAAFQLEEVCVTDEESITGSHIATDSSDFKFLLKISNPVIPPSGMQLSAGQPQCISTTGINDACLNGFTCSNCVSHHYSVVQTLSWNPIGYLEPRSRNLSIKAEERANANRFTELNFTLDVANTNRPPIINNGEPLVPLQIQENTPFTLNLPGIVRDDDGDTLVYNLDRSVTGMSVNSGTGLISWTPAKSHLGDHILVISAQDRDPVTGTLMSKTTAIQTITVKAINNPPRLDPQLRNLNNIDQAVSLTLIQDQYFEAQILAYDEEGDTFTFSDRLTNGTKLNGSALPANMLLSSFGRLSWTPGNANVGANTLVVVARDDSKPNSPFSSQTFILTVLDVNDAPVITDKAFTQAIMAEDEIFSRQITFTDVDAADNHFFGVSATPSVSGLLSSSGTPVLTVSPAGLVKFHPNSTMAGVYNITAGVQDQAGAFDSHTYTIIVNSSNNPPVLEDIPDLYVSRDASQYNIQLYATDPEGDPISYFFVSTPTNISINQQTGILSITEKLAAESQEFFVYARDSSGNQSQQQKIVLRYVDAQIQIPQIISPAPTIAKILREYRYQPQIQSSGENLKIEIVESERFPRPPGMNSNNVELAWTPAIKDLGSHLVRVRAVATINGQDVKSVPQRYFLNVTNQNQAPVLTLATDISNQPINQFDATEGVAVERVVAFLTEFDLEDSERFQIFFNNENKSDEGTSHPASEAVARVSLVPEPIQTNPLKLQIVLSWTPDNAAAFASQLGYVNTFSIAASDGITQSNIVTVTVNVTNTNNLPQFYPDENQGESEIAYVGSKYQRNFFARDLDGQITYFCMDTSPKNTTQESYPGLSLKPNATPVSFADDNRFNLLGQGSYVSGAAVPPNALCRLGDEVSGLDLNPRRGKLSKITLDWDPIDSDISIPTHGPLLLLGYDNIAPSLFNGDFTFITKLAPSISSLTPPAQFRGREVVVAGGGILNLSQPMTAKFLLADGTITATTSVYGITTTGTGKILVPDSAQSGYISIGYSDYSSPVPFTVLNGETSAVAGFTQSDSLSSPSGMVSTFSPDNGKEWIFVSDFDRHVIHFYELATGSVPVINNMAVSADQVLRNEIIAGRSASPGDINGTKGISRLNQPSGLSIARHQNTTWLLIADSGNHKIKVLDLTDLYRASNDPTNGMPVYTLTKSTQLYRPYKAIQHPDPAQEDMFYIANTYGNTVELFEANLYDSYGARPLSLIDVEPEADKRPASEFTLTVAGTGFAFSNNGALLKPVDLAIQGNQLFVSSYSGTPYSFHNSSRIFHKSIINRNDENKSYTGYLNNFSVGRLVPKSVHEGEHLLTIQSTVDNRLNSLGFSTVLSTPGPASANEVHTGYLYASSDPLLTQLPSTNLSNHLGAVSSYLSLPNEDALTSQGNFWWQTREVQFQSDVSAISMLTNPTENSFGAAWASIKTSDTKITPMRTNGTMQISGFSDLPLPTEIGSNDIGTPTFYDINKDYIADLFLPVPLLGTVYVFPGVSAAPASPATMTFDTTNYWKLNSTSLGCSVDCLNGVQHVNFGRYFTGDDYSTGPVTANTVVLGSDDMTITVPSQNLFYVIEAYHDTKDSAAVTAFTGYSQLFFNQASLYKNAISNTDLRKTTYELALDSVSTAAQQGNTQADITSVEQCGTLGTTLVLDPAAVPPAVPTTRRYLASFDSIINTQPETLVCQEYEKFLVAEGQEKQSLDNLKAVEGLGATAAAAGTLLDGTTPVANPSFFFDTAAGAGGTVVDLTTAKYASAITQFNGDVNPYELYPGAFDQFATYMPCKGNPLSIEDGNAVCNHSSSSVDPNADVNPEFFTHVDLFHEYASRGASSIDTTVTTFPRVPVSYSAVEKYMKNIQQIVMVNAPNPQTGAKKVSLLPLIGYKRSSSADVGLSFGDAVSPVVIGGPFGGNMQHPDTRVSSGPGGLTTPARKSVLRGKKESVLFVDSSGKLNIKGLSSNVAANGKMTYTVVDAKTSVSLLPPSEETSPTAYSPGEFVLWDFNKDGLMDLASLHPQQNKLTIRLGTGATPVLAEKDPARVQELQTQPGPKSISVIQGSTSAYVDLIVANEDVDSVTVFKAEVKDRDNLSKLKLFQQGVHFNSGTSGNSFVRASIRNSSYQYGFNKTIGTDFLDNYVFGRQSLLGEDLVSGMSLSLDSPQPLQPNGTVVVLRKDPTTKKQVLSITDIASEVIIRSTVGYFTTTQPTDVKTPDLNLDGIGDLVTLDAVNKGFSINLSNQTAQGFVHDPNTQKIKLKGIPSDVTSADFNLRFDDYNTRYPDLAFTLYERDSIVLYYNGGKSLTPALNPDFTFTHTAYPSLEIPVGNGPVSLANGDLNKDGYIDIVVANNIGNNICVLYGQASAPGTFTPCVFYPTNLKPREVILTDVHDHIGGNGTGLLDIVVLNQEDRSVQAFINNGSGFNPPVRYRISDYYPARNTLRDVLTQERINPFTVEHFSMESGDFGNVVTAPGVLGTEFPRYENLIIGNEVNLYTMKNIGNQTLPQYRSSITKFNLTTPANLTYAQTLTAASGVYKSLAVSGTDLYFSRSSLSDTLWATNPTSLENSVYLTGFVEHAPVANLTGGTTISRVMTPNETWAYVNSSMNLRNDDLGNVFEAMQLVNHPVKGTVMYALHSGTNKGLIRYRPTGNFEHVIGNFKRTPTSQTLNTKLGENISLNQPAGMVLDPSESTLLVADSGNGLVRMVDLRNNVVRNMQIGGNPIMMYPGLRDLTNQYNTYNFWAIDSQRLYFINQSQEPIVLATQTLDVGTTLTDPSYNAFAIEGYQNRIYVAARDNGIQPAIGRIYRVDLSATPYVRTTLTLRIPATVGTQTYQIQGLTGMALNKTATKLYFAEWQTRQIKVIDLTVSGTASNVATLAGIAGVQGHYDGSVEYALINKPGAMQLNEKENRLYFIDGSTVRSLNLENLGTGKPLVLNTISGNPYDTGIINAAGTDSRYIRPEDLTVTFNGNQDVIYISDSVAHNVRRIVLDP